MKTFPFRVLLPTALCIGALLGSPCANAQFSHASAKFDDDGVFVCVDEGVRRVRLRALNSESGLWELVQMAHLSGEAGHIKLRVPAGMTKQELKVDVSMSDPFPYAYYSGKSSFGQTTSINGAVSDFERAADEPVASEGEGDDDVVESDIWHIRGDRLYFFNQLRGLQIFGLDGEPEPTKLGSLRLPAVGEQMYVLDERYTILLAARGSRNQSEVVLTEYDETDGLREARRIELPGSIVETRLIGGLLYVVTRFSEHMMIEEPVEALEGESGEGDVIERWVYKTGLDLTVIDFSDPSAPKKLQGLQLAEQDGWGFYNAQVAATSTHILVSTTNHTNQRTTSDVYVIDISEPASAPVLVAEVPVAGGIADKFKMSVDGNVLTTVSQMNDWSDWSNRQFETVVETFEIGAELEDGFNRLDEVRLGFGEQLFATRFDDDRLYIVTFLRIDPFWVVDLADPRNLRILGELEVPGFSRYLQPVGDNILAIGVEDRVVTASLFNATDPTNPQLLSRVSMGEGYSWSEANYDEKAISFNEEEGILLVPYQSYNNGEAEQKVQIIDVAGDSLTKRGTIDHGFTPRRAGLWNDHIVSVSGRELIVVDASNRDDPTILSDTVIAWNADSVIESGGYLFQLEEGYHSYRGTNTRANSLRVTTVGDPETVLSELPLGEGSIIGVEDRGGYLYLLASVVHQVAQKDSEGNDITRIKRMLQASVVDISNPPSVSLLGQADYEIPDDQKNSYHYFGAGEVKPIWLADGRIAWATSGGNNGYCRRCFIDIARVGDIATSIYYQPQVDVHVLDVSDKASPVFLSSSTFSEENSWSYSEPVLIGEDQIAFSYQKNTWLEGEGRYHDEHRLRVVDLANPASQVMLEEVSIPGRLSSVVQTQSSGTVLITQAQQSAIGETPEGRWWQDAYLQASVYDGLKTFLLDEVAIPGGGYATTVFDGAASFRQLSTENETLQLLGYVWDASTGLFARSEPVLMEQRLSQLALHDGVLFGWQWPSALIGVDITEPLVPGEVEEFPLASNLGVRLERIKVDRSAGAWLPIGAYGVEFVDFGGVFSQRVDLDSNEKVNLLASFDEGYDQVAALVAPAARDESDDDNNNDNSEWIYIPFDTNTIETTDSDGDGKCNITDPDDDNDGIPDGEDSFPLIGIEPSATAASPLATRNVRFRKAAAGDDYCGYLRSSEGNEPLGRFEAIVLKNRRGFSARMIMGNTSYLLKGKFRESGRYSKELIPESGSGPPATVELRLVKTASGAYKLKGTVKRGNKTAKVIVVKAGDTSALAGRYTLLLPGDETQPAAPQGHGYGTLKLRANGSAKMRGRLGDGKKWTARCHVTTDGEMPLYKPLYNKGKGWLAGLVRFRDIAEVSDCDGVMHWRKPGKSTGFNLQRKLVGSRYDSAQAAADLGANPVTMQAFLGAGAALDPFSQAIDVQLTPENGLIEGIINQSGTDHEVDGVWFHKQGFAAGNARATGEAPRSIILVP